MHTHIAFFFIKWGLVRNKGALPFCRLWSKPAKDESFIFSRYCLRFHYFSIAYASGEDQHKCRPYYPHLLHNMRFRWDNLSETKTVTKCRCYPAPWYRLQQRAWQRDNTSLRRSCCAFHKTLLCRLFHSGILISRSRVFQTPMFRCCNTQAAPRSGHPAPAVPRWRSARTVP